MLESPEIDETRLAVLLDLAKERSGALGARRRRRSSVAGLVALVLIIGSVGTAVAVRPQQGRGPRQQASNVGSHPSVAPSWKLVGNVTQPSWQEQPPLNGPGRGYGLVCPTATACYVQEEDPDPTSGTPLTSVAVTHDGGSTWQQSSLPAGDWTTTGLACVDADTCMAGGADGAGNDVFLTTDDGGQTWTSLPGPSQLAPSFLFLGVSCTTSQSCVAIGEATADDSGTQADDVLMTTDGGAAWADSPLPADFVPTVPQCLGGDSCMIVGFEAPSGTAAPSQGAALYSADGGASWTAASVPDGLGPITAVACSDQVDCVAATPGTSGLIGPGQVLATTDGGQTWAATAAAGLPAGFLQELACPTSSMCWAAGLQLPEQDIGSNPVPISQSSLEGLLAMTDDGGQTWQLTRLPADLSTGSVVTAVACPTSTNCFATVWLPNSTPQGQYVLLSYDSSGS